MKEKCLILMVRSPRKGEVKRRLCLSIGEAKSLEFYKRSGLDILETIKGQDHDVKVGFFPGDDADRIASWLGDEYDLIPQIGEDLGKRQSSLLEAGFKLGYSRVCVMISDSPDIPLENIISAFDVLKNSDCVIGPSPDGGYYLIGFSIKGFSRNLFMNMEWSNPNVTIEMKRKLDSFGIEWKEIEPWQDVDDIDDLRALINRNPEGTGPKRTMELLRRLELP